MLNRFSLAHPFPPSLAEQEFFPNRGEWFDHFLTAPSTLTVFATPRYHG